jgi:hypothetical protein
VIRLKSQLDLAFASSGYFFGVLVITNTSNLPGVRITGSCTDRGW